MIQVWLRRGQKFIKPIEEKIWFELFPLESFEKPCIFQDTTLSCPLYNFKHHHSFGFHVRWCPPPNGESGAKQDALGDVFIDHQYVYRTLQLCVMLCPIGPDVSLGILAIALRCEQILH